MPIVVVQFSTVQFVILLGTIVVITLPGAIKQSHLAIAIFNCRTSFFLIIDVDQIYAQKSVFLYSIGVLCAFVDSNIYNYLYICVDDR
jgi:hypothetical protein